MSVVRRAALGAVLCLLALAPAAALAHGGAAAHHSLRAPVTDQNFYFVMADRFQNGDAANDDGGLPPGTDEGAVRLRPDRQGLVPRRRPQGPASASSTTSRASARRRSGSRRASRTRPSRTTTASRPPATTATGSPTSRRSTRTSAPTRTCATSSTRAHAPRHQGLLRHHLQPHGRRHRVHGGRRQPATRRRTSRRTRPPPGTPFDDRDYAGGSTFPALAPTGQPSCPATAALQSFPYHPCVPDAEQRRQGPGLAQRRRASTTTAATRRSSARTPSTATSSGSTTSSPRTRRSSTA